MNGEYHFLAPLQGKPTYQKLGCVHTLRYFNEEDCWVLDLEVGLRGDEFCNAYAKAHGADWPCQEMEWYVWEKDRNAYVLDLDVSSSAFQHRPLEAKGPKRRWAFVPCN